HSEAAGPLRRDETTPLGHPLDGLLRLLQPDPCALTIALDGLDLLALFQQGSHLALKIPVALRAGGERLTPLDGLHSVLRLLQPDSRLLTIALDGLDLLPLLQEHDHLVLEGSIAQGTRQGRW